MAPQVIEQHNTSRTVSTKSSMTCGRRAGTARCRTAAMANDDGGDDDAACGNSPLVMKSTLVRGLNHLALQRWCPRGFPYGGV